MIRRKKDIPTDFELNLDSIILKPQTKIKYLGVTISDKLKFNEHVKHKIDLFPLPWKPYLGLFDQNVGSTLSWSH